MVNVAGLWSSVAVITGSLGLPRGLIYLAGHTRSVANRRQVLRLALIFAVCGGILASTLGLLILHSILFHLGSRTLVLASISMALVPIGTVTAVLNGYLEIETKFGAFNRSLAVGALTSGVGVVVLGALGVLSPLTQVALLGLGSVLSLITSARAARQLSKSYPREVGSLGSDAKALIRTSGAFWASSIATVANWQMDQLFATAWLPLGAIGLYAVATSSLSVVNAASNAVSTVMFPTSVQDTHELIVARAEKAFRTAVPLMIVVAAGLVAVVRVVLVSVYGPAYAGAFPAVLALGPAMVMWGASSVIYQGCYALGRNDISVIGEITGAVSGLIALWLLIPAFGLVGAAIGTSVSTLCGLTFVVSYWRLTVRGSTSLMPSVNETTTALFGVLRRQLSTNITRDRN